MKPDFALNLSHDGLSLLHRAADGWRLVGDVALDDPEMAQNLGFLRGTASDLAQGQLASKLVIPNSQILYREINASEIDGEANSETIHAALDGTTPYPVQDLVFDWAQNDAGIIQIAAVTRETLEEAENFATEHRFNPVSFVAIPDESTFSGEPFFGQTRLAGDILDADEMVEKDTEAMVVLGAIIADTTPDTNDEFKVPPAPPEDDPVREPLDLDADEAHLPQIDLPGAFATRRGADEGPALISPDPSRPAARFVLYADKLEELEESEGTLPDLGLGGASRDDVDIASAGVTARSLPGETKPKSKKKKPAEKRQNPPRVDAPHGPIKQPEKGRYAEVETPPVRPPQMALDGDSLPVFGARRMQRDRPAVSSIGLFLGIGLLVVLALTVLTWSVFPNFLPDEPVAQEIETTAPSVETQTSTLAPGSDETDQPGEPVGETVPTAVETTGLTAPTEQSADVLPVAPDAAQDAENRLASLETIVPAIPDAPDLNEAERAEITGSMTPEVAQEIHSETGIWVLSPIPPVELNSDRTDDIYVASIDRRIISNDAIALPSGRGTVDDVSLPEMLSPPAAGTRFDLDERGFVRPRPEGAANPDGIQIYLGKPSYDPDLRPGSTPEPEPEIAAPIAPAPTPTSRPLARPTDLVQKDEKARLGGRTRNQLAAIRPLARPASPQDIGPELDLTPTALAVSASPSPTTRPGGFSSLVEKALAEALANPAETAIETAIAAPSTPTIPTRASVARAATSQNAINLSRVNLIGVYGSSSDRRALVRLKNGRYVKVQVGDRLDGGKVAAIGTKRLQYTKSGQTVTLEIAS